MQPRPRSPVAALTAFGLAVALGCGPSEADVDRRITERLVSEKLIEPPPPPPDPTAPTAPAAPPPSADPVADSLAFLASLDELMKDYTPSLPKVLDDTDSLRCMTTDALKNDAQIKGAARVLEKRKAASARVRDRAVRDLRAKTLPLNYRIDDEWRTRNFGRPALYGCLGSAYSTEEWAPSDWTQADCQSMDRSARFGFDYEWSVRVPAIPDALVYPDGPPELMRRIDKAKIVVPPRFSCRVDDLVPVDDHRTILCEGVPQVRLFGTVPAINVGDVVSVPLAGVKRAPNGVLWKNVETSGWLVDADASALRVDEPATCPSVDEILATAGGK